ncbi:hypothetical protein EDC01DRAFT_307135 [Geopyxis carbonaria]|nr:hypothetical protein EDC01DRAFT_307135 [Geopyxis carbonaria]
MPIGLEGSDAGFEPASPFEQDMNYTYAHDKLFYTDLDEHHPPYSAMDVLTPDGEFCDLESKTQIYEDSEPVFEHEVKNLSIIVHDYLARLIRPDPPQLQSGVNHNIDPSLLAKDANPQVFSSLHHPQDVVYQCIAPTTDDTSLTGSIYQSSSPSTNSTLASPPCPFLSPTTDDTSFTSPTYQSSLPSTNPTVTSSPCPFLSSTSVFSISPPPPDHFTSIFGPSPHTAVPAPPAPPARPQRRRQCIPTEAQCDPANGPHKSEFCGRTFRQPGLLTKHNLQHTRPFGCAQCGLTFPNRNDLDRHVRDQHIRDPSMRIPCDICKHSSRDMSNMKKHMQDVHGREWVKTRVFKNKKGTERGVKKKTGRGPGRPRKEQKFANGARNIVLQ